MLAYLNGAKKVFYLTAPENIRLGSTFLKVANTLAYLKRRQ